jgi:hypothetical protein
MMEFYNLSLRLIGLKKSYKYIVLAPEIEHFAMSNLIVEGRKMIKDVQYVIDKINLKNEDYIIKYRSQMQFLTFPTDHSREFGYGNLIQFCRSDTTVIGPPGSAMIECLINGISFFNYFDYDKCSQNSSLNNSIMKFLYVAKNKEELLDNILNNRIFRLGFNKSDLLYSDGKNLNEIVESILQDKI